MNSVVTTTVAHEHLRMCIVEMPSVIVSIYCECPSASLPCHRAIEVGECHILVVLPAIQHKAEICVTTIPPDAEDITVSVQAHQVVEVDLVDCLILCSGEVELVSHLVREEEVDMLINHFSVPADYDGVGSKGAKFVFYV